MSTHASDLTITIDLAAAERGARVTIDRLMALRQKHDTTAFEYCKSVRIAPYVLPHSHPVITLNTFFPTETGLLATYIHEQMHWYATWFSHRFRRQWKTLWTTIEARYPDPTVGGTEGARDRYSTHLHLIVNWLEIEGLTTLIWS